MGKRLNPRHGSMQFWPRVRSSRPYSRLRSIPSGSEAKLLAFAGYKAGMTHVIVSDNSKNSITKGEQLSMPVTVIECPPLKISSLRIYKAHGYGTGVAQELFFKTDKEFLRKATQAKQLSTEKDIDSLDLTDVTQITVQVYTQPKLVGFGKKKPEVFEIPLGGKLEEQLAFVKENIGKEISVKDIFNQGSYVDVRAITTGRGYQGPLKRFGISLRAKKSEKTRRGPGSLGGWKGQGHFMYRIAFAGQTGYHQRIQYNNLILGIYDDVEKVNPKGGFISYGNVKNTYILVKGSIPGPKKRLVSLTAPHRSVKKQVSYDVTFISTDSKQGN